MNVIDSDPTAPRPCPHHDAHADLSSDVDVRKDMTAPQPTHPRENAENDVPHTSCILGRLKSLARNKRVGVRA